MKSKKLCFGSVFFFYRVFVRGMEFFAGVGVAQLRGQAWKVIGACLGIGDSPCGCNVLWEIKRNIFQSYYESNTYIM